MGGVSSPSEIRRWVPFRLTRYLNGFVKKYLTSTVHLTCSCVNDRVLRCGRLKSNLCSGRLWTSTYNPGIQVQIQMRARKWPEFLERTIDVKYVYDKDYRGTDFIATLTAPDALERVRSIGNRAECSPNRFHRNSGCSSLAG